MGFEAKRIQEFRDHFLQSTIPSIDAFIQEWPKWEEEGKAAIAAILLRAEYNSREKLFSEPDWYQTLVLGLRKDPSLCRDELGIITFNYDRSLEYFLMTAPRRNLNRNREELDEKIKRLRIRHFYGSLGDLWEHEAKSKYYGTVSLVQRNA